MKLIFDESTRACLGAVDGPWHGSGIVVEVAALPDDLSILSLSDDGEIVADETVALARAKAQRIAEIKRQAAANITAMQWRIERAQERDRLGMPGETLVQVLLEREAIRRASNRAQAEVEAAQDVAAVEAVQFSVTDADRATPQRLSRLEFLRRFTEAEMEAIVTAAEQSPALKTALLKWQTAEGIVVTDPETVAGVNAMEIAGLLAAGRAGEILSA